MLRLVGGGLRQAAAGGGSQAAAPSTLWDVAASGSARRSRRGGRRPRLWAEAWPGLERAATEAAEGGEAWLSRRILCWKYMC